MSKVVGIRRDENGAIELYKLDDGRCIDKDTMVAEADAGKIYGVSSFTTRDCGKAVRSDRGYKDFNLDSLPEF